MWLHSFSRTDLNSFFFFEQKRRYNSAAMWMIYNESNQESPLRSYKLPYSIFNFVLYLPFRQNILSYWATQ